MQAGELLLPEWAKNSSEGILAIISMLATSRPCISSSRAVKPYFHHKNGKEYLYGDDLNLAADLWFVVVIAFESFKAEGKEVLLVLETST